ncbi:MAG: DUF559 domain-containing protein [bacterium]|nr:DUF559 domain-containing protein [bacterium]
MTSPETARIFREEFLATEGPVIVARRFPRLRRTILRWAHEGHLRSVAPGVFVPTHLELDGHLLLLVAMAWLPTAVVQGEAAAFVHGIRQTAPDVIDLAYEHTVQAPTGFRISRRKVPTDQVLFIGEICVTSPALTAIDLAATDAGASVDHLRRTGQVSLEELWAAFQSAPSRPGNEARRRILERTTTNPWSNAERDLHSILDSEDLQGWVANHPVLIEGNLYFLDVAFPEAKLAIEVDGWEFHSSRQTFESDRRRQNALVSAGWTVLRFTVEMLEDSDYVVESIRSMLTCPKSSARS